MKYTVNAQATASVSIMVEAATKVEALEKAQSTDAMFELCWQCGCPEPDDDEPTWGLTGELDGSPMGPFEVSNE